MEPSSAPNCILKRQVFCLIVISLAVLVCMDQDYYSLLGASRASSSREIRQAFKKLALKLHPDKNKNDPDAHDKFLKINRAYEVLKDEDLRKKYDKYGEKGLEDQQQQGGRYESWHFYRYDFGIYDDDPEVITLDRGEFDGAINSGELWFVNFYSPRCSHCHDLAPTWREFAKEMDGLIRVGAVNCGDDRMLCRSRGINSYPSLYIFKAGMDPVKYFGDRVTNNLINFAMNYVSSSVTELWAGNFRSSVESSFASGVGWLITFCTDSGDCLSSQTRLRLAGMLDGLVSVGWMDCSVQADLCENLEILSSTTAYFPPGVTLTSKNKDVLFFSSLDAREIYEEVIEHVPDLEMLSQDSFKDRLTYHRWLVLFSYGIDEQFYQPEFKKLPVLLHGDDIQVGRFDCQSSPSTCKSLYIKKPSVVAFKGKGIDYYEIHHGKVNIYDLISFTKESVNSHVVTLGPENFPENDRQPWLVDFFAPWCPPCRALLPELRKASKRVFSHVRFGTLDCTIHEGLCNMHNIRAYPTTVIFNQSNIHEYGGHHSAEEILEFIEDLRHPSVVTLTAQTSVRRTHVIDDESDYFSTDSNQWLSMAEREALRKKEQELQELRHASRLSRKVTIDFAGRKVFEEGDSLTEYHKRFDETVQTVNSGTIVTPKKNPGENRCDSGLLNPKLMLPPPMWVDQVNAGSNRRQTFVDATAENTDRNRLRIQDRELQEISDQGMCLSMHQPWASLLVAGIKRVEGRTWYSAHRGRLWIAAAAKRPSPQEISELEASYRVLLNKGINFPKDYPTGCLLGCVEVADCLSQDQFQEQYPSLRQESASPFVFVCTSPQELLLKFPIKGQHKIWKLDSKIHQGAKKGLMLRKEKMTQQ